jgi:dTMP kinase
VVIELHRLLCGGLQPDLTILLESDVAKSLGRARRRNQAATHANLSKAGSGSNKSAGKHPDENRFEQQNRAFFSRVREGYQVIAAREPRRVAAVDASGSPAQTHRRIVEILEGRMKLSNKSV